MATTLPFPVMNVVPAGYRWSAEAAKKAGDKSAFIRVGGTQVTKRFLSGARRSWTSTKPEEQQTIFHTTYRITGTPENVRAALTYAGVSPDQIQQVLDTAITRDNFNTTMAAEVQRELAAHEALKRAKPVTEGYDWPQILWFAQHIKEAVISTKAGEQKGGLVSPGRAGGGESLAEKIRKLQSGKVLDVSEMDINTGKGVRTKPAPKTAKTGKFGTGRIPIISNNIDKYIRALQLAYGPDAEQTYAQDIQAVRDTLLRAGAPAMVSPPPLIRAPSPVTAPGATLAPPPQFVPATTGTVPRVASPPRVGTVGGQTLPQIPPLTGLLQGGQ